MYFRVRLIGIFLCALSHGVWLGASSHALIHNHAFCTHDGDHASADQHDKNRVAEIEVAPDAPSDCAACQLSLAAPDVPALAILIAMPEPLQISTPSFATAFIPASAWSLPFGHAPPIA
jgi:hypothetical protein